MVENNSHDVIVIRGGPAGSFQVIRGEFDHILLKNAAKNGTEVREETSVIGPTSRV